VGSRFYDGFTRLVIQLNLQYRRLVPTLHPRVGNSAVLAINWKTFFLVPPASTAEKAAPLSAFMTCSGAGMMA
jgi:hypothetical protein